MIGLLGGTFDPIHYGHLRPAHEVHGHLGFDALHIVPSALPPHRRAPSASAAHRLRMVQIAIAEFPGFVADDREVRRGGISYTVPTLESVRAEIGTEPLCFVLGADAFAGLPSWHRWEELFTLAHLVVMQRPGTAVPRADSVPAWAADRLCDIQALRRRPAGGLLLVTVTPQDVSATRLRATIAQGRKPSSDELPPAVWDYIVRHHLYRSAAA